MRISTAILLFGTAMGLAIASAPASAQLGQGPDGPGIRGGGAPGGAGRGGPGGAGGGAIFRPGPSVQPGAPPAAGAIQPRAARSALQPGMRGGIEPRIRSGQVEQRYRRGNVYGQYPGAGRPLTVTPGIRYNRGYDRNYAYGRRGYESGWLPGLFGGPFFLPWGPQYGYDPGPAYYEPYYEERYSAAPGGYAGVGNHCATPQKVCLLYSPSYLGNGCSCRAPGGGRFRGAVVP